MRLSKVMRVEGSKIRTENDAMAYNTIDTTNEKSPLVDLFGTIGALRNRDIWDIIEKYERAYSVDRELAVKMLFYAGDIRGGLGERRTFRTLLKWLALENPEVVKDNIELIPFYNRWDSLFVLVGTEVEDRMWTIIEEQLVEDINNMGKGKPISLLAKWMPSNRKVSKETLALAYEAEKRLNLSPRSYRRMLSELRGYLGVTEKQMCNRNWHEIDYEKVPAYAMKRYGNAFKRNDPLGWEGYISALEKGEKKVNASTLFPYDLVGAIRGGNDNTIIEEQWKALPNYVDENSNVLVMADVSPSMEWAANGRPMNSSIGLAIYFAERNKGEFGGLYMTFSSNPNFVPVNPLDSLKSKIREVMLTGVGYSTNLEAAMQRILDLAVRHKVEPESLPKALVVVSDMEIDSYTSEEELDFVQEMKRRFKAYGYELPKLVLWNVESRQDVFLTQGPDVLVVSGNATSTFRNLLKGLDKTNIELMLDTLNDERYSIIRA